MNMESKPAAATSQNKKWIVMNGAEKTTFVVKVFIMVCTLGFVFGNVLTD